MRDTRGHTARKRKKIIINKPARLEWVIYPSSYTTRAAYSVVHVYPLLVPRGSSGLAVNTHRRILVRVVYVLSKEKQQINVV